LAQALWLPPTSKGARLSALLKGHHCLCEARHIVMGLLPRWLFNIPVQVGPVTEYARKLRPWMHTILVLQVIICVCRLFVLKEITGVLWMLLVSGVGWYALYVDLNITYVCVWGALCLIQGFLEFFALLIPGVVGILKFSFLNTVVRVSAPLVYLLGALFAWHLFHDYETSQGHKVSSFDPMAKAVDVFGCDEKTPMSAASSFLGGMAGRAANAAKGMRGGVKDGGVGTPENPAAAADYYGAKDADAAYAAQRAAFQAQYGATQMHSGVVPGSAGSVASATWGPQSPGSWQQAGGPPGMMQHPFSTHGGPGYGQAPGSAQSLLQSPRGAPQVYGRP